MKPFLIEDYSNPSQPYFFSRKAKQAIKQAREMIASCINAEPDEIFFTSGGTESDNWAIKCFTSPNDIKNIVTSEIEHHAILNACKTAYLSDVIYLPVNEQGEVNPDDLQNFFDRPRECTCSCEATLVSIMLGNNEIGTIQPVEKLAEIAHKHGAIFHTDAVQAVGHIPIDVKRLGVNMLSASAHKFNGPKGIGFLYCQNSIMQPFHNGGSQEMGMRAGTENVPAIVAMAIALKNN
jgi:cysteine desulfurase